MAISTENRPLVFFVRVYGTADAEEDRATVAEAVFYENAAEWFAEYPAVKKKLDVMNRELMMTVGIRYNVNGGNKVYYILDQMNIWLNDLTFRRSHYYRGLMRRNRYEGYPHNERITPPGIAESGGEEASAGNPVDRG